MYFEEAFACTICALLKEQAEEKMKEDIPPEGI
jgi:hypothetical protein